MPRTPPLGGASDDDEVLRQFREMIAGMGAEELQDVGRQLLDLAGRTVSLEPMAPESRRRPRRDDEVTFRVRADLDDASPPIWRRLELLSSMRLDELHDVLQVAFGWTDSHLHRFAVGTSVWDRHSEVFLCPYDVEEGDTDGVPAGEVRLDEVLGDPGDVLRYAYDYGDGWEVTIRLEAVAERGVDAARAACTGGRGVAPPDDSGGIHAWNESRDDEQEGVLERFDPSEVDAALREGAELVVALAHGPVLLRRLLATTIGTAVHDVMRDLVLEARLDLPIEVDVDDVEPSVRPYLWLLDRVGDEGITLTSAGYLPPAVVLAAMTELGMDEEWFGKGNRESLTLPVLDLRTSAQSYRLVRKYKGRLVLTSKGRQLRDDPIGLWWHLVPGLLPADEDSGSHHAGVLCLLAVAAGRDIDNPMLREQAVSALSLLGWRNADGSALDPTAYVLPWRDTQRALRDLRAFDRVRSRWRSSPPTPGGRLLARAALQRRA